jgi:glycosyltransferase involved in cell wall biosynthesis
MKFLFVTPLSPWHRSGGAQERQRVMLKALRSAGDVDVVVLREPTAPVITVQPPADTVVHYLARPTSPTRTRVVRWLATGTAPSALLLYDSPRLRADFDALLADSHYDVFWSSTLVPLMVFGPRPSHRVILDLYDLEDQKFRQALPSLGAALRSRKPRALFHRALAKRDASAWAAQQRRMAQAADAVLVCSGEDRARLSAQRTVVVPNGAHEPNKVVDHRALRSSEPTITLHGSLGYPPNTEAARVLVDDVAPRVRAVFPDLRIRLVGEAPPSVEALHAPPAVTVTGFVPDIGSELRRTDLVAVPLRSGSGTRLKIIEAFAHGVPVVASSVAANGLDACDGRHLLIRDEPRAFAAACIELLARPDVRTVCIDNATALYRSRYRWASIERQVGRIVGQILGR